MGRKSKEQIQRENFSAYHTEWCKKNQKRFNLAYSMDKDAELIHFLEAMPNKSGYVRNLVLADMAKQKGTREMIKYEITYQLEGVDDMEQCGSFDTLEEAEAELKTLKAKDYGDESIRKGNNYARRYTAVSFLLSKNVYDEDGDLDVSKSESLEGKNAGYIDCEAIYRERYSSQEEFEEALKERDAEVEELKAEKGFDEVEIKALTF